MDVKLYPAPLAGTVAAPPSKSRWHRELICQAAAGRFPPVSPDAPEDIRATAAGLRVLYGGGEEVPCGASGSTLRFLLPLAMTLGREVTFTGTPRLLERVMPGLWGVTPCPGGLRVTGRLTGGVYRLPGGDTSQLISGMLMALPLCREDSRLEAPGPVSRPYVDLTAWVLERYGVVLHRAQGGWRIPGGQCFAPLPMEQEGDWSAAAYWLVLAALGQGITVTGLRQDSRQGDRRALTLCRELPQQVSLRENPDLLPPLALLAALRPDKEICFTDAARLRHKESDRLAATAALLTALGGRAQETADGLIIVVVTISHDSKEIVSKPDVISRGFVYVREAESLIEGVKHVAGESISDCLGKRNMDWSTLKSSMKASVAKYIYEQTKRSPMILPIIEEI